MEEKLICPLCLNSNLLEAYRRENTFFSINLTPLERSYNLIIYYCNKCGFVFQGYSYFNKENYLKIIKKVYTQSYNLSSSGDLEFSYNFIKEEINKAERILEIGSLKGDFIKFLDSFVKEKNFYLIDPSLEEFNLKNNKVYFIREFFKNNLFEREFFDLIIIRNLLEHIVDFRSFLEELKSILKEDGKIFIEVPSLIVDLKNRVESFIPEHVNYFYGDFLKKELQKLGFNVLRLDEKKDLLVLVSKKLDIEKEKLEGKVLDSKTENLYNLILKYNKDLISIKDKIKKEIKNSVFVYYGAGNQFLWSESFLSIKDFILIDDRKKGTILGVPIISFEEFENSVFEEDKTYIFFINTIFLNVFERIKNKIIDFFKDKNNSFSIIRPWKVEYERGFTKNL